ncbi:hypothetical protein [Dankookia sp. P2]|uniref:hypothetical protein n=1 Tax=Dankookia sp. P2 TaxID=3423955 RepID=UPI003D66EB37
MSWPFAPEMKPNCWSMRACSTWTWLFRVRLPSLEQGALAGHRLHGARVGAVPQVLGEGDLGGTADFRLQSGILRQQGPALRPLHLEHAV